MRSNQLMIPVYLNEKIVLDMLAIIEDGFSMVSQVSYAEHKQSNSNQEMNSAFSTSNILSKLLKIDLKGGVSHSGSKEQDASVDKEKIHTNVSLLSKFRKFLEDENILKTSFDIKSMQIGDYVEIEGELQKNPLINCLDNITNFYRMAKIFVPESQLGSKVQSKAQRQSENKFIDQLKSFVDELKHSNTIDFILSDAAGKIVLSTQEQYLANDNISEILGGRFKVLGKVIKICKDEADSIDLLRKTPLSILTGDQLAEMFSGIQNEEMNKLNFPKLETKIHGPAAIIIPVAIYA